MLYEVITVDVSADRLALIALELLALFQQKLLESLEIPFGCFQSQP